MEVEVAIQVYLKERLGRSTPQIRLPEDYELLSDYGPIRIMHEELPDSASKPYIQVQLPHIESLKDVTLHLAPDGGGPGHDLRLDALGERHARPAGRHVQPGPHLSAGRLDAANLRLESGRSGFRVVGGSGLT